MLGRVMTAFALEHSRLTSLPRFNTKTQPDCAQDITLLFPAEILHPYEKVGDES